MTNLDQSSLQVNEEFVQACKFFRFHELGEVLGSNENGVFYYVCYGAK